MPLLLRYAFRIWHGNPLLCRSLPARRTIGRKLLRAHLRGRADIHLEFALNFFIGSAKHLPAEGMHCLFAVAKVMRRDVDDGNPVSAIRRWCWRSCNRPASTGRLCCRTSATRTSPSRAVWTLTGLWRTMGAICERTGTACGGVPSWHTGGESYGGPEFPGSNKSRGGHRQPYPG